MGTIIDDARTHLARLDAEPLREVDSLILSAAAYFDLSPVSGIRARRPGVRIGDLAHAENYDQCFTRVLKPHDGYQLLTAMAANPRFRGGGGRAFGGVIANRIVCLRRDPFRTSDRSAGVVGPPLHLPLAFC